MSHHLAIDLGASGGRAVLGHLSHGTLCLELIAESAHSPIAESGRLCWDWDTLRRGVRNAIQKAASSGTPIASVGIDAWGVDFGLIDYAGQLTEPPGCYRDPRGIAGLQRVQSCIGDREQYAITGTHAAPINTACQLLGAYGDRFPRATRLQFIADLLNFELTGRCVSSAPIASTSQLLDARARAWALPLVSRLGLPASLLPALLAPGAAIGPIVQTSNGHESLSKTQVLSTGGHDSACAVAAAAALEDGCAFLSAGTWFVQGVELDQPVLTDAAREAKLSNEAGIGGKIRLVRNLTGLWIVQECRRQWLAERVPNGQEPPYELTYSGLMHAARAAGPQRARIDINDAALAQPGDMPKKIREACAAAGQPAPATDGGLIRCVYDSLAASCAAGLDDLERVSGRAIHTLCVVGGGARDVLLCQALSDASGRRVLAGPSQAAAIGNILVQALGLRAIRNLRDIRRIVAASFETTRYGPSKPAPIATARARLMACGE